ncbi:transcriptional regulator, AraC family [Clostridium sp. KLE 1755]|uniref:response regulator n=1 Tax=Clostridium sp. KLE 1755 TaxID=1226325 RepID=UPI0003981925|nr:helix-turn-helix domain-containing protein [Clostridium sp. KLE 1755]ERI65716.1 transcriptional regulator, AraC family [Clostridium sp. KLE 1755]
MRLLIADDEDYAREGLIESIPWEKYGIDEIMQAKDGREALTISGWFRPDIVLTDIRMPKLNGLEFAERLIRQCPDSKLLFMSGYMEIEYLKKAISLDAVEFVEKPIELDKVEQAVKKAVTFVREKELFEKKEGQWQKLERQRLLNMLKLKTKDKALIEKLCREVGFPEKAGYLTAVLWNKNEENAGELEPLAAEFWKDTGIDYLLTMLDRGKYLFLGAFGAFQQSRIREKCREMAGLKEGLCLGIGFETDNLMAVAASSEIALLNAEQSFFKSERRIFEIEDGIPEMKKLNPGLYAEFDRILKEDAGEVTAWLHELAEKICGEGFYRQEDIVMLMSAFARLLIQEKNALLLSVEGIDTEEDAEQKIREASSMAEVMELFDRLLEAFGIHREKETQYSRLVRDTITYIEQHCREAELSVTDIAADMHFSAAHLNVLFRKETGVTVKQYISDYRLNLSKKLLCNPHIKVSEIAERCGYSNANYFSKVFRASENMTPVEYRKENCK